MFKLSHGRKLTQGAFLLLFLFLLFQTESKGGDELGYPVRLFLDSDPFIFISALISARGWEWTFLKGFLPALPVIAITLLMGRVFCGWACPLGTVNDLAGIGAKTKRAAVPKSLRKLKYLLLIFLLTLSLASVQLAGVFDPLSFLIRSLSLWLLPGIDNGTRALFNALPDSGSASESGLAETVFAFLKAHVLSFHPPSFGQGLLFGSLFLIVIGLNRVEKRFWCRYLCPLGALLGVFSVLSPLRKTAGEDCSSCGGCVRFCRAGASGGRHETWFGTECVRCMECRDNCPKKTVRFGFKAGWLPSYSSLPSGPDLGRRHIAASFLAALAGAPLIRLARPSRSEAAAVIRPPGSGDENRFLSRCIRCGECMKVCITNGLQPMLLEGGLEGIWTPKLVPRLGFCEYGCNLCGQVCPTYAIPRLEAGVKKRTRIGCAEIDQGRCLPYAESIPCIVCEEVCPTPRKSIRLDAVRVRDRLGRDTAIKRPRIDPERCIGCGACEKHCPVEGAAAITVKPLDVKRKE
ncbi:MAG: 4Fe-4S dicluster domain-containing protein [Syntrophales bacterium]|nr:4Fe-4S dicluster domain-containing protein [Syntrophales bacterium]